MKLKDAEKIIANYSGDVHCEDHDQFVDYCVECLVDLNRTQAEVIEAYKTLVKSLNRRLTKLEQDLEVSEEMVLNVLERVE